MANLTVVAVVPNGFGTRWRTVYDLNMSTNIKTYYNPVSCEVEAGIFV